MNINIVIRKMICFILAVLTICSGFVFAPKDNSIEADAATNGYYSWSGYATYLKGAGTEENPFLVSTPNDLAYFRKQVADASGNITYYANNNTANTAKTKKANTAYYKMTNDIYYNDPNGDEWKTWSETVAPANGGSSAHTWTPPGYNDVANRNFEGSFDGNGYTIYGMYIVHTTLNGIGFIGTMRYGVIKNLTLAKGYVHGNHQVGAFIGQSRWGTELVNCISNMRVVGNNAVGGIIGGNAKSGAYINTDVVLTNESTVASLTVYNCQNNSVVDGKKWVGGIMGYISAGAARVQIEECVNNGTINSSGQCSGGVLGGTRQADGAGHNVIESCTNYGSVTGTGFTGGVVGCGRAIDIYLSKNYGTVQSTGGTVGGISGGNNSADKLANGKIYYCYNEGNVTGVYDVGGISGGGKSININQCANVGIVTGTYNIGGILGRSGGTSDVRDTEVYDCYNAGAVVSTTSAPTTAGIVGNVVCEGTTTDNKYAKIKRCINVGTVTGGRAIAATESILMNDSSTGLFVFTQFDSTCFGLSGINTVFDGGRAVSSMTDATVISALGTAWDISYPLPSLKNIDYNVQNYNNRAEMLSITDVSVTNAPALAVKVSINNTNFYESLSAKSLEYGVLVAKSDSFNGELKHDTASVLKFTASAEANSYNAIIRGQSVADYDDMYTIRPFVCFLENGQTVYIYGTALESSYYTAKGVNNVPAVNETAIFECSEKLYLLVGGSSKIECKIASTTDKDSITFISSNTDVATVADGVVKGIKAGTATVTVTYTGVWGAVTRYCKVTVLDDLLSNVIANKYAEQNGNLRIHTNKLVRALSITKNDATVLDYNGTVFAVDGGNNNDEQLKYFLKLREEYLSEGLASGTLTEAEYYRHLLSSKCQLQIVVLLTHWHTDHINGLRYHVSADPRITVYKLYTMADASNTSADGHSSYINTFDDMVTRLKVNSPNLTATQFPFETQKIRYFSGYNSMSTTDTTLPIMLHILPSKDWSTNSLLSIDATEWQNSSSTWFVFEFAGRKLLFTGDSYIMDTGATYTGALTSGNNAIDFMLYKYKSVVDTSVDFMDCNHHGRAAYNENLFTATQPSIVLSTVYYGNESVALVNKAVTTADVYLGGDGEQVFIINSDGVFDTSRAVIAYAKNVNGHAIRNRITLKKAREYGDETSAKISLKTPTGVKLSSANLEVALGSKAWLAPTVAGDSSTNKNVIWEISDTSVVTTDGAYITAHKAGTATVTVKAGNYSAKCMVTVISVPLDITSNIDNISKITKDDFGIDAFRGIPSKSSIATVLAFFKQDAQFLEIFDSRGNAIPSSSTVCTGYTVNIVCNSETKVSYALIVNGDVNCDGTINGADYLAIASTLTRLAELKPAEIVAADINNDAKVSSSDYLALNAHLVGVNIIE